jgi:hypothetical protein
MEPQPKSGGIDRRGLIWGGLLILAGIAGLMNIYIPNLATWIWSAALAGAGFLVFGVYLTERSNLGLLIPAYALWAAAALIAIGEWRVLPDELIGTFIMVAVGLPFLVVFLRDRSRWWALLVAFIMLALAVIIPLDEYSVLPESFVGTFILAAIALPFLVIFLRDRSRWWALIPAYALLAIGIMIPLTETGVLSDLLVPAYIMFVIAIPFFVIFARDPKQWWPLIPGGIMALMGVAFLIAEAAVEYVAPVVLIIAGVWILVRRFVGGGLTPPRADSGGEIPPAE